jgi:DNA transposition AAA+ family ATPase
MSDDNGPPSVEFLITKEYRRFAEFCHACRRERYIGLCYGPPGIGKTLSARYYAQWDLLAPVLPSQRTTVAALCEPAVAECRCLFYTPAVTVTPKQLADELQGLSWDLKLAVEGALNLAEGAPYGFNVAKAPSRTELLLVDEADRLKFPTLEQLRDLYDRSTLGLVLIGMPGLEKRLARYAQLYSRVGFVHQFRPLSPEELRFILERKWQQLGLTLSQDDFTDAEAMAAIARITGGNFRLVQRLFTQMERILRINQLHSVTKEVVEAARETLVIAPA